MGERHIAGGERVNPFVRIVLENPINALTLVSVIFGGGAVYSSVQHRMGDLEKSFTVLESRLSKTEAAAARIDTNTANKFDGLNRDLTDVKVAIRGIQTSVEFLVQQERQRTQRAQ